MSDDGQWMIFDVFTFHFSKEIVMFMLAIQGPNTWHTKSLKQPFQVESIIDYL